MGEVLLFDGRPYPATAIAATDAQCLVLSAASVRGLASDNGVFAALFMERLSTRVRTLVDRLERQTLGAMCGPGWRLRSSAPQPSGLQPSPAGPTSTSA